ncbi:MAG TPA: PLP-dependent aminotransferase family protein [Gaiellaceae bacterium]
MAVTASRVISFARGVPAPECLAVDELAECARAVLERDGKTILSYGPGAGYTPLRELIGEWFGVSASRVVITNGSLNGFVLLSQRLARGKNTIVELPTYDRAIKILLESGATVTAVGMDDDGMVADELERQLRQAPDTAFVYTIPTFQNPTGRTMSEERRKQVVEIAKSANVTLFEDDPYSLVRFDGERLPSLFDLTGKESIYSSSFSKTISPGLRVGFFILPEALATEIGDIATSTYITPVLLAQATVHEFITRGLFEPNLKRVNGLIKARRDAMLGALEKHFSGARWTHPAGGYFVWLDLEPGTDAKEVIARADGVTAVAGPDFGAPANSLRLAYSFVSPEEIETGVERLAAAV